MQRTQWLAGTNLGTRLRSPQRAHGFSRAPGPNGKHGPLCFSHMSVAVASTGRGTHWTSVWFGLSPAELSCTSLDWTGLYWIRPYWIGRADQRGRRGKPPTDRFYHPVGFGYARLPRLQCTPIPKSWEGNLLGWCSQPASQPIPSPSRKATQGRPACHAPPLSLFPFLIRPPSSREPTNAPTRRQHHFPHWPSRLPLLHILRMHSLSLAGQLVP